MPVILYPVTGRTKHNISFCWSQGLVDCDDNSEHHRRWLPSYNSRAFPFEESDNMTVVGRIDIEKGAVAFHCSEPIDLNVDINMTLIF